MFKTLYARLSLVLIALLCALGAAYIALTLYTTRLYQQQMTQRLNRTLAENLVANKALIHDGKVDKAMLDDIFHTYMVINPSIEVYLLGPGGRILGFSAPPGVVKRTRVSTAPIRAFLRSDAMLPILGDDPRDPGGRRIFSAAPVRADGGVDGYLYVVLAGQHHDSITGLLHSSYVLKLSTAVILASLLFGLAAGLFIFNVLTRRLRRLAGAMEAFQEHNVPAALDTGKGRDEIDRLAAAFMDMSRRITAQVDALKRSDALRRELVANVSHDLRTPIASLQGYLETLRLKEQGLTPGQQRAYLDTALKHSERLGRLTSELFELSRLESGDIEPHMEPFALGDLAQDVAIKFRLAAEQRGIHLATRIPRELPLVYGDIALMERVLENLIENALQHTPRNGTVSLAVEPRDGHVTVTVADTGRGIPPDKIGRVFDRFYQAEKIERDRGGGAGLGLAIAKGILNLHGEEIHVQSELNAGAAFSFRIPVCAASRVLPD